MIETSGRSASLNHDSITYVPSECNIRCLRDQLIIRPLNVVHSNVLVVVEDTRPLRGVVVRAGPGCYPKKYDHNDKHKRTKVWDSKLFRPTQVKPGDIIELGGYEYGGYAFQTFWWGETLHLWCREEDVSGIVDQEVVAEIKEAA